MLGLHPEHNSDHTTNNVPNEAPRTILTNLTAPPTPNRSPPPPSFLDPSPPRHLPPHIPCPIFVAHPARGVERCVYPRTRRRQYRMVGVMLCWYVVFGSGGSTLLMRFILFTSGCRAGGHSESINKHPPIVLHPQIPSPPPASIPSSISKSKSKALSTPTTNPPKRKLGALISPNTSPSPQPQPQRSFSFSSSYASSPLSTPSRTLNYTLPSPSLSSQSPSFAVDSSLNSSFGSSSGTGTGVGAASPLAAYRGKHADRVGRALDGSFLAGLASGDESD
jgi:hypothetical protein